MVVKDLTARYEARMDPPSSPVRPTPVVPGTVSQLRERLELAVIHEANMSRNSSSLRRASIDVSSIHRGPDSSPLSSVPNCKLDVDILHKESCMVPPNTIRVSSAIKRLEAERPAILPHPGHLRTSQQYRWSKSLGNRANSVDVPRPTNKISSSRLHRPFIEERDALIAERARLSRGETGSVSVPTKRVTPVDTLRRNARSMNNNNSCAPRWIHGASRVTSLSSRFQKLPASEKLAKIDQLEPISDTTDLVLDDIGSLVRVQEIDNDIIVSHNVSPVVSLTRNDLLKKLGEASPGKHGRTNQPDMMPGMANEKYFEHGNKSDDSDFSSAKQLFTSEVSMCEEPSPCPSPRRRRPHPVSTPVAIPRTMSSSTAPSPARCESPLSTNGRDRLVTSGSAKRLPKAKVMIARRRGHSASFDGSDTRAASLDLDGNRQRGGSLLDKPGARRLIREYTSVHELHMGMVSLLEENPENEQVEFRDPDVMDGVRHAPIGGRNTAKTHESANGHNRHRTSRDVYKREYEFIDAEEIGDMRKGVGHGRHIVSDEIFPEDRGSKQRYRNKKKLFKVAGSGKVGKVRHERHLEDIQRRSSMISGALGRVSMAADPWIDFITDSNSGTGMAGKSRGPLRRVMDRIFRKGRGNTGLIDK